MATAKCVTKASRFRVRDALILEESSGYCKPLIFASPKWARLKGWMWRSSLLSLHHFLASAVNINKIASGCNP